MMYTEFIELTQTEVTFDYYTKKIEPIYMNSLSSISKDTFCKQWVLFFNYYMHNMCDLISRCILYKTEDTIVFHSFMEKKQEKAKRWATKMCKEVFWCG
jgi:hypothetical protein